jgi:hypothetical protein
MGVGDEANSRRTLSRTLSMAALANAVLWALSIIALIFVMQRCPSAKGLFVILAAGLATASALVAVAGKQR